MKENISTLQQGAQNVSGEHRYYLTHSAHGIDIYDSVPIANFMFVW